MAPNNPLAKLEKWGRGSTWKMLRPPTGPQGEKSLSRARNRRKCVAPKARRRWLPPIPSAGQGP
eukprot:11121963-Alexandrium_andersonii.AAC.1